ncbi:MAG TPA: prolipoprotein diacylglyceryl transferase [Gaiellaceae bacterium]|nr:prolipoprotein diacylglyceryl transferase [Gaiellaceae bacterium]
MSWALASIPSPSSGDLEIGPVALHAYGVMLLLGIVAATWLTGVRWVRRGGDWDLVYRVAMWGVLGGIVGARLYHVITSWSTVDGEWWEPFAVWEGGLGIWGGIAGGVLAGAIVVRRAGESVFRFMDAVAPGLLLAQAIGRFGNYFNQELFGEPTDLPWGLEIDPVNRPEGFEQFQTFHPTFLYEFGWNLLGVVVLLLVDRRFRIKPPGLFALYVAWYTFGRFWEELLRIDPSHEYLGLRLNAYVSIVCFVAALAAFVWSQRREERGQRRRLEGAAEPRRRMAIPKGRIRHGR